MELKLSGGKYVVGSDGYLEQVSGTEETIQRLMCRLGARHGAFYPMPDFGSRLHTLASLKSSARAAAARQFVHEALEDERDVEIVSVECKNGEGNSYIIDVELEVLGSEARLSFVV